MITNPIEKTLTCIVCPNGCKLQGVVNADGEITVSGNLCARGVAFWKTEITAPVRSLTTTVKTTFPDFPYLPVRTDGEIPKDKISAAIAVLRQTVISHNAACGDVLIENILDTGINIIATTDL